MKPTAFRVSQLSGEGAISVYTRAKELEQEGRSILHLELGEPDFHPPPAVLRALGEAVASGRDRYCSPQGLPVLREAIADYLFRTRKLSARPDELLITPGCKMALSLALTALVEPGDELLYPDPGFPIYASLARGLGARAVPYGLLEKNRFQPDLDEIAAKISPQTKAIVVNSPGNPTGTVFSLKALERLAELAEEHDLWILSDEVYARILFEGSYTSPWSLNRIEERTIVLDGFSKSFAMTGWRLGYAVAPVRLIRAMELLVLNSYTCVAEFTQLAAVEALRDPDQAVDRMVAQYRERRDLFVSGLNRIPGFRCLAPDGAFYAWVHVGGTGRSAAAIQELLLEQGGVAAIAGSAFGAQGEPYVRFSLVSARAQLEQALGQIREVAAHWGAAVRG